ncbi:CTPS [Mytilus edulis]|uniref:CTP synthase n=1 Tax=Mytilus edulis TaxID=6550 RepID=A0A8S3UZB2_MYTED|nr:CTPS [Mytilus edulis]
MDRYSKKKSPDDSAKRNLKAEAMQEVLPGYEEYLVLLQERNRLLKRLRKKSKKQIDIERKEQGFSIYVNGANTEMLAKKQKSQAHQETPQDDRPTSGRLKTAGDVSNKRVLNLEDLNAISQLERQKMAERNRAKTAPARERRRNWQAASVEIKTERGENRRIKAPEMITGNYEDDFEDSDDEDDEDSDDEQQMRASMSQYLSDDDSDSDIEIDASKHNRFNKFKSPPKKNTAVEGVKRKGKALEERINEKLELSISDVKKLRQSLCMNASIRESLAREVSSDEELSDRDSPIPEEDEDIIEDLVPATDSVEEKKAPVFKPTDTIVLELDLPQQKKKVQHNLSAARKKDIDDDTNGYRPHRKDPIPSSPRGQKSKVDSVVQANVPSRSKQERPLSANRRNQPEKVDTNEEASAVMAALKAENEKTSKLIRNTPSTPERSKPRPSSLNPQRKSVEARPMRTPTKDKSDVRGSQNVNRSKDGPSVKKSQQVRESNQGRESVNVPQSPRQETSDSFLKNDKLTEIMKKVLLMQPKQQKKLMTVLTKIEGSVENEPKQKPNTPVKATEPVNNMVNRQSKNVRSRKSHSPDEMTEVNIELVSTWGHKEQIGLTELQFFDKNRKLIPISTSNVTVHGARDNSNLVDVLFNGKGKTNKDRNMWCCRYKKGVPVEMCILLPVSSPELLSRIKIWNYNKSMQDLEIGVKHARIFIGGELVFDGVIEKGCGNQVFDYGFIINLNEMDDQPSPRSPKPSSPAHVSPTPPSRPTDVYSEPKVQHRPLPKPPSPARQSRTEKLVKASTEMSQQKVSKSPSPVGKSRNEDVIMTKPKPVKFLFWIMMEKLTLTLEIMSASWTSRFIVTTTLQLERSTNMLSTKKEGDYLGKTVQVVPHITDAIMDWVERVAKIPVDGDNQTPEVCIVEVIAKIPVDGDHQTPKVIVCRSTLPIADPVKAKISLFCHVKPQQVFSIHDVSSLFRVPLLLHAQGVSKFLMEKLEINTSSSPFGSRMMMRWKDLSDRHDRLLKESLQHSSLCVSHRLNLRCIEADHLEAAMMKENPSKYHDAWHQLVSANGVLVPGGFGKRGVEGKCLAANWARTNNKPFLGVCLGLQCAVIEYSRNVLGLEDAHSTEFNPKTKNPVVIDMPEHNTGQMGGTMRLGKRKTLFNTESSILRKLYGKQSFVEERHRHRYEVNPTIVSQLEGEGMKFVGRSEDGERMEIMELQGHPYYVGVQYHPEYLSRPMKPSAPYLGLLLASTGKLSTYVTRGFRLSPHLSYSEGNDEELDEEIAQLSIEKSDSVESTS